MKKNKYILLLLCLSSLIFTSCLVDDEVISDSYNQGPNFVGFDVVGTATVETTSVVADGEEKQKLINVNVTGPTFEDLEGDVTITYSVNEELSTAVEGTHFLLEDNTLTLTNEDNYMGNIPVTILTEGIEPPVSKDLVLTIEEVTSASGEEVIVNGRRNEIIYTINYNCFSDLAGTYEVVTNGVPMGTEEIVEVSTGVYKTETTGTWSAGEIAPDQGLTFQELCGTLTVPLQDLAQGYYTNDVYGINEQGIDGTVDENGDFELVYEIWFEAGNQVYTAQYTRID